MIRRAIEALPEKQRAAVLLHKYQEMGYDEIAKVLQCSESALKSLLFRAYETSAGRACAAGRDRALTRAPKSGEVRTS